MNCGLCAEYCPFDAIKMDHDYEIAVVRPLQAQHLRQREAVQAGVLLRLHPPGELPREEAARAEAEAAKAAKKAKA